MSLSGLTAPQRFSVRMTQEVLCWRLPQQVLKADLPISLGMSFQHPAREAAVVGELEAPAQEVEVPPARPQEAVLAVVPT